MDFPTLFPKNLILKNGIKPKKQKYSFFQGIFFGENFKNLKIWFGVGGNNFFGETFSIWQQI